MSKQNSSKTKPLSEAHIQATCTAWLELDGWRCIRTDLPHLRGLGVQERGMPDNLYIRYKTHRAGLSNIPTSVSWSESQHLWVEFKKRGGKAEQHQKDWHAKERARGALVWVLGEDMPATIEGFCFHYAASGLQRKRISIPR